MTILRTFACSSHDAVVAYRGTRRSAPWVDDMMLPGGGVWLTGCTVAVVVDEQRQLNDNSSPNLSR